MLPNEQQPTNQFYATCGAIDDGVGIYLMSPSGGSRFSLLPDFPDPFFEVLADLFCGLPDHLGFVIDRESGRYCILQFPNNLNADLLKLVGKSRLLNTLSQQSKGKVSESVGSECGEQHSAPKKDDLVWCLVPMLRSAIVIAHSDSP
jgi:hypothetical protein